MYTKDVQMAEEINYTRYYHTRCIICTYLQQLNGSRLNSDLPPLAAAAAFFPPYIVDHSVQVRYLIERDVEFKTGRKSDYFQICSSLY